MFRKIYSLSFIVFFSIISFSQTLTNGGFEDDLFGWKTELLNASAATFSILENASPHSGRKNLEVNVSKKGRALNSVRLTIDSLEVSSDRIYMIRFWAKSDQANSRIIVNFEGSETNIACEFRVDNYFGTWKNGWQMYQYLFTSTDNLLEMIVSFNTIGKYYIDDIEIIDDTHPVLDLKTQLMWQNNLQGYGWASGDNDVSVVLPDKRVAWIFSDSFLGWPNPNEYYLREGTMINNLIVLEDTVSNLTSLYTGTQSNPRTLVSPPSGNVYWISDGIIEDGKLKVMYNEWRGLDYNNSAGVATFSLPDLTRESLIVSSFKGNLIPNALLKDDDYVYIYTEKRSGFARYTNVARVPVGSINNAKTTWEFYLNTNTWGTDHTKAKNIISAPGCSVRKLGNGNYVMSGVPNLSTEFAVWFAPTPYGPWGNKKVIYNIPAEEGVLFYLGHIHERPETESTGLYTLSYSLYPFGGYVAQQMADKGTYLPIYLKANLRELSPYTDKSSLHTNYTTKKAELYPNPTFDIIQINGVTDLQTVQIFDLSGLKISEESTETVNVNYLSPGVYIAQVFSKKNTERIIFIKR